MKRANFDPDPIVEESKEQTKRLQLWRPEQRVFDNPYLLAEIARRDPDIHETLTNVSNAYRKSFGGLFGRGFRRELAEHAKVSNPHPRDQNRVVEGTILNGQYHSFFDEPAVRIYDVSNRARKVLTEEQWLKKGWAHRENGPAVIRYSDGEIESRHYYKNGVKLMQITRDGSKVYYKNGSISLVELEPENEEMDANLTDLVPLNGEDVESIDTDKRRDR